MDPGRGPGDAVPLLIWDQTKARRDEKILGEDRPPPLV